jgi:RNA polymerase sigma factor (sigma-70 family)
MGTNEPAVFVVDDDPAVCEALQGLLEAEGFRAAVFHSAEDFLAGYRPGQPGCLVLDMQMNGMNGLELQAKLEREQLGIPVIIISGHGSIPTAVHAMKTGAIDFLEKPVDPQLLLRRIRHALAKAERLRTEQRRRRDFAARLARLTPRERLVMDLVVVGRPTKEIAAELGVTVKTVEAHRKRVLQKMGVTKAVALARLVTAGYLGLSSLPPGGETAQGPSAGP